MRQQTISISTESINASKIIMRGSNHHTRFETEISNYPSIQDFEDAYSRGSVIIYVYYEVNMLVHCFV